VAGLVLFNMLANTLLIPTVRPFFATFYAGDESSMHAFFSVNMLGAVAGAPLLAMWADRRGGRRKMAAWLALIDGLTLLACTVRLPIEALLAIRVVQGAASVAALSLLMGVVGGRGNRADHGGSIGLPAAALVVAIALGAPLGTLLLKAGPSAVFYVAAALALATAVAILLLLPADGPRAARGGARALLKHPMFLRVPALWIGIERFTVGCFVVTFSLYAHRVLGLSDGHIGMLFSWFLIPFAIATWPMATLVGRIDRGLLLAVGAIAYGGAFLLLGEVSPSLLPVVLGVAGTASAAIYGPSLCLAASLAPPALRATAMGLTNAAGTLGMLAGTATAGIVSAILIGHGVPRETAYVTLFQIAGAAQLLVLVVSLPHLLNLSRRDTSSAVELEIAR